MTVTLSAFYDHLLPELPGCTTALVDLHLLHVARDFCETTACWRYAWELPTVADEATYDIAQPELQTEIVRVLKVSVSGALLWDAAWREPVRNRLDTSSDSVPKYPRDRPPFTMNDDNTELTFITEEIPSASDSDGLALVTALKPAFAATVLPDFLKTQHLEAIRTGTLSRLMVMKKPWGDRDLAVKYAGDHLRLVNAAAHNAQQGNTGARMRTTKTGI